jgi:CRP-like cAMP-binding protein
MEQLVHHIPFVSRPALRPSSPLQGTRLFGFGLLSREEKSALEVATTPEKSIKPQSYLVREEERVDALHIVTDGWAFRYATTRQGGRQLSALLLPGDIANLDSLMFDEPDYGIRTITETTVVSLPKERALALAAEHPGIARTFTWLGLVENAILSKWALSLGRKSAIERFAHLMCELSVRLGVGDGNDSRFTFPLTQELLGDALGLTNVHVNRTMQQLRSDGLIATDNRTMILPNLARLREVGGFDPHYLHAASREHSLQAVWGIR